MITTKQLLKATRFKSVRTLQRWRERNLVPPPTLQRHPTGRGMCWMWPSWTIRHIAEVKKRISAGGSLNDIARTFSTDWRIEAKKYHRKRHNFEEACKRMECDEAIDRFSAWASDYVYDYLRNIGVERPGRIDDKIGRAVSKPQFINNTKELLQKGFTPVMIVTKKDVTVAADFVLSSAFGNSEAGTQPALVIPIRDAFIEVFATIEPNLSKEPRFTPSMQVVEHDEAKTQVRNYRHTDKWNFILEK